MIDSPETLQLAQQAYGALAAGLANAKSGKTEILPQQLRFFSRVDAALGAVGIPGRSMACGTGCHYCCHFHVYITASEAFTLAEFACSNALSADQQQLVMRQLDENVRKVATMSVEEHIHTNVRCAFLSEAGHCLAYRVRPLACRRHHSYDVQPCKEAYEHPEIMGAQPMSAERTHRGNLLHWAAQAAADEAGVDARRYEMSGAILEALRNPASLKRWRSGKAAFPSVHDRVVDAESTETE